MEQDLVQRPPAGVGHRRNQCQTRNLAWGKQGPSPSETVRTEQAAFTRQWAIDLEQASQQHCIGLEPVNLPFRCILPEYVNSLIKIQAICRLWSEARPHLTLAFTSFFSSLVISSLKQMLLPNSKDANTLRRKWIMELGSALSMVQPRESSWAFSASMLGRKNENRAQHLASKDTVVTRAIVEAFICPQKVLPVITIKVDWHPSIYLHGLIQQILIGYVPGIKQGFGDLKKDTKDRVLAFDKVSCWAGETEP